jgi:hypothetical protein
MKKIAQFLIGDLPLDLDRTRRKRTQGLRNLRRLLRQERKRKTLGVVVRFVRITILRLNYIRLQFWIDQLRDWLAFIVLKHRGRSLDEIADWRDRYYLFCFAYFICTVFFLPAAPPGCLRSFLVIVSATFLFDMVAGLLGSALVWHAKSVSAERNFINALLGYGETVVAFAAFYRVCGCLNINSPDVLQSLYFSAVVFTSLGFGDIFPKNSTAPSGCGNHAGLILVLIQMVLFVLFVLIFFNAFLARAVAMDDVSEAELSNHETTRN